MEFLNSNLVIFITLSALTSLSSQLDLSSLMGMSSVVTSTTPAPQNQFGQHLNNSPYNNNTSDKFNNLLHSKPNKGNIFQPFPNKGQFPNKDFKDLTDLNKDFKESLNFNKDFNPNKDFNKDFNNFKDFKDFKDHSGYNPASMAAPVENPVYSLPPPRIDDGSYIDGPLNYNHPSGQGFQYNNHKQNDLGYDLYRQLYGYKGPNPLNHHAQNGYNRPNYGQRPLPQQPIPYRNNGPNPYGNGHMPQSQAYPNHGQAYPNQGHAYGGEGHGQYNGEVYGGNTPSYGNVPGPGGSSYGPIIEPPNYETHNSAQPYGHEEMYENHYNPSPDYSKYVEAMPYSELSDYISQSQYHDYAGMLYSAHNLPYAPPSHNGYQSNYSTPGRQYKSDFKMVVAVASIAGASFDGKAKHPKGNNIEGTLFISEIYPYICLVSGVITGLPPNYKYGIAIHTFGDITNDCQSIGGHYNPNNNTHGNINYPQSHAGDLGNVRSDGAGVAFVNKIARKRFSIENRNSVSGRSIGICEKADDLGLGGNIQSLRDGNCGSISACGLIGYANTGHSASNSGHYKK